MHVKLEVERPALMPSPDVSRMVVMGFATVENGYHKISISAISQCGKPENIDCSLFTTSVTTTNPIIKLATNQHSPETPSFNNPFPNNYFHTPRNIQSPILLPCASPFYCQSISTNKIMKEQSDLRKSFLNDTQPTTTRPTRRTTIAPQIPFPQSTRKSSMAFADLEQPEVLRDERYEALFENTLRDTRRVYKYLASEQETAEQASIKQSIAKVLREAEEESDFNERFLIKPKLRAKTARAKRNDEKHIGLRQDEREAQRRRSFFSNHKKIIGLEEECMLLEYFLKDEDEHRQKTAINYLSSIPHTSRYRRLTPTTREADRLHATHDQQQYRSLKRRVHLKQEFVQRCAMMARKNLTFRRRENFREIEYILRQNNRNMMEEGVQMERTDQERLQLRNNNCLIRLFLRYEFFLAHNRVYEYFTEQCFGKFKGELFAIAPTLAMREGDIDRKVAQVMEFKQTKTLHFQDFKEVVLFIDQLTKTDTLALFLQKCPQYFEHPADPLLKTHQHEIDRYMTSHKIKFLLQLIFETFPDKLIGKKILPIKLIPSLLKAYGITEKDFDLHHLFHSYHWMQHYDAGLTFEEFYRGSILMGVKGNNWKGIEQLLRKIDIKKYL